MTWAMLKGSVVAKVSCCFFNFDLEFKFKCEGGIYWGYLLELSKRVMYEGNSTVTELQFRGILGSIL